MEGGLHGFDTVEQAFTPPNTEALERDWNQVRGSLQDSIGRYRDGEISLSDLKSELNDLGDDFEGLLGRAESLFSAAGDRLAGLEGHQASVEVEGHAGTGLTVTRPFRASFSQSKNHKPLLCGTRHGLRSFWDG